MGLANAAAILGIALAVSAAAAPARPVEVRLENVRWQALSDGVMAVYRGPDGRIWYQVSQSPHEPDVREPVASIEREFAKPSPVIVGAKPALFEPGGRVWFITQSARQFLSARQLLGYDGKTWVKRAAEEGNPFVGQCPGHRQGRVYGCNLWADDKAFFPQQAGVTWYDGKEWSYQAWPCEQADGAFDWVLVPDADGRELYALVKAAKRSLWRFRDGKWVEVPLPKDDAAGDVEGIAPALEGGVWLRTRSGMALHEGGEEIGEGAVAPWLSDLASGDFQVRERATAALVALGPGAASRLEAKLSATKDLEVKYRLREILDHWRPAPGSAAVFGDYLVSNVSLLATDLAGGLLVGGILRRKTEAGARGGVVWFGPKGEWRDFFAAGGLAGGAPNEPRNVLPLFWAPDRTGVWTPRPGTYKPAAMLSFASGTYTDQVPDSRFGWVHTVAADGTVFVGHGQAFPGATVAAYKPGAPDTRHLLSALPPVMLRGEGCVAVADDGTILADTTSTGVGRFDGREWKPVNGLQSQQAPAVSLFAGTGRAVLAEFENRVVLCDQEKVYDAATYENLIERYGDAFARTMRGGRGRGWMKSSLSWAVDSRDNVWLLRQNRLIVWSAGRWLDATAGLKEAGASAGQALHVAAAGDGSRVYVDDAGPGEAGEHCFLGEVRGGQAAFVRVAAPGATSDIIRDVRDAGGGFWVPSYHRETGKDGQQRVSPDSYRVTEAGIAEALRGCGPPLMADASGNVWLRDWWGGPYGEFRVWRQGAALATVRVPTGDGSTTLFSDRPGSVWAFTPFALVHLAADAARPTEYRPTGTFFVPSLDAGLWGIVYSELGYVAAILHPAAGGRCLMLYEMPK